MKLSETYAVLLVVGCSSTSSSHVRVLERDDAAPDVLSDGARGGRDVLKEPERETSADALQVEGGSVEAGVDAPEGSDVQADVQADRGTPPFSCSGAVCPRCEAGSYAWVNATDSRLLGGSGWAPYCAGTRCACRCSANQCVTSTKIVCGCTP